MDLQDLYDQAKEHKEHHKSCGGEPYKSFLELERIVGGFGGAAVGRASSLKVLEIGTAVGFTTFILQNKNNFVDSIEMHEQHIILAKENVQKWGGDISKINFILGDAQDILPKLITPGKAEGFTKYDIIFFDGYGAKHIFYVIFENLLEKEGILITANRHLKSTENSYFEEFDDKNKWEFVDEFADTVVHKKIF